MGEEDFADMIKHDFNRRDEKMETSLAEKFVSFVAQHKRSPITDKADIIRRFGCASVEAKHFLSLIQHGECCDLLLRLFRYPIFSSTFKTANLKALVHLSSPNGMPGTALLRDALRHIEAITGGNHSLGSYHYLHTLDTNKATLAALEAQTTRAKWSRALPDPDESRLKIVRAFKLCITSGEVGGPISNMSFVLNPFSFCCQVICSPPKSASTRLKCPNRSET